MTINPENVRKIKRFVKWLLDGLNLSEYIRPNLLEQAIALEELAQELRAIAANRD